jgi:hypothetical protein
MDDESVAVLRLMAKMNATVVRPAQMLREKNLSPMENGHDRNSTLRDNGQSDCRRFYGVDLPVQGPLPELSLQGIRNAHDATNGNGIVCEPDLNLQPKKQ